MNEAPVGLQSRELSEAAAECESPYIPTNKEATQPGGFFIGNRRGLEPLAVVNEAPVGLQSRELSEAAVECESPIYSIIIKAAPFGGFLSILSLKQLRCPGHVHRALDMLRTDVQALAAAHAGGGKAFVPSPKSVASLGAC